MANHIGTSGFSYPHWRGVLYPRGLPTGRWLEHYAAEFNTVELNGSFYRWPREDRFAAWRDRLPEGFRLSVKAPRGLTHGRRLQRPEEWIDRIRQCWKVLGPAAGILLVQLPPNLERDEPLLERFLSGLGSDVRVAVEFRHESWQCGPVLDLLRRHGAAYCITSGAGLPEIPEVTADFAFVRMHGPDPERLYVGSYPAQALQEWAERIRAWNAAGVQSWVYFNNDIDGAAVSDARRLKELLAARPA